MKKTNEEIAALTAEEFLEGFAEYKTIKIPKKIFVCAIVLVALVSVVSVLSFNNMKIAGIESLENVSPVMTPMAAATAKKDVISIPSGVVKANPFVPYRKIAGDGQDTGLVNDVPAFSLIDPPEIASENSAAAKIMDTVVSGILYDKFSPSAILNIDGSDHLVKKGDTVSNYKIIAITRDSVTVQHGSNTYKAGIGELLTEGEVNYNEVSNLNRKFGGESR